MNRRAIIYVTLRTLTVCGCMFVLPLIVSLIYRERASAIAFGATALGCVAVGALSRLIKVRDGAIYARDGLIIVSLAWLVVSFVGAIPFVASGTTNSYIDALFETVSGFTTTGASVFSGAEIEATSRGVLFWRSFTHWVGGIGVLVFVIAVLGSATDRPIHVLRAEMPGPAVDKFVPKSGKTVKILCLIYLALGALMFVMLVCGGMSAYDALLHTFGTAGTGGFGIKADGVAGYNDYIQIVIAAFMLVFAVNFNVYFLIIAGKAREAFKSTELKLYLVIVAFSIAAIAVNIYPIYGSVYESVKQSGFQVASIISTTGFTTADYAQWGTLSQTILLLLTFVGGCAGSTAGGFKVVRVAILAKAGSRELKRVIRPRAAAVVRLDGRAASEESVKSVCVYAAVYFLAFAILFLLLGFDGANCDLTTNFTSLASCFNNVGPAFGAAGPAYSYACFGTFGKIVLTAAMLLGRLELYPLLALFSAASYKK